jgi:parallel beta-helix repeat protein
MKGNASLARGALRWAGAASLACLLGGAGAGAANDLCGATILEDLTLDHDLACTGDGLVLGADGIKVNLNGHTLSGAGVGVGIAVFGRTDVEIKNGVITSFAVGVRLNTSTDIDIKHMELAGNPEGIDMQAGGIGNTIKDSVFRNSATRAIMLRSNSRQNDIKHNHFIGNRVGILVFGGVDNTVKDNFITGSTFAGIRINVIATGNELKDNTLESNAAGVEFLLTPTGWSMGNTLKANRIAMNGCGLKGPTAGNTFIDNWFEGNVADTCP